MNVVSGARISKGGLHLGHYLGCIQPLLMNREKIENYIFVLNECGHSIETDDLHSMLFDLYAIKNAYQLNNLHVMLDSDLLADYQFLLNWLERETKLNNLLSVYPKSSNSSYNGVSVDDFLFPIKQSISYFAFNAEKVFLNDDNIRFVEFAAKLAVKINQKNDELHLLIPKLVNGKIPRLLGYNYEKMSKHNENAIFLSDNKKILEEKIYKLFDMRQLFGKYPKELESFKTSKPYLLPDYFLPYQYIEAFSDSDFSSENLGFDIKNSFNRPKLRNYLIELLNSIILPIQEAKHSLTTKVILNNLHNDIRYLKTVYYKPVRTLK